MSLSAVARPTLERRLAETADLVTVALDELLPRGEASEVRLTQAMRYAVLGPGQRLRPFLALESARLFDVDERGVLRAACAVECVHASSLVHADLPALDPEHHAGGRAPVHRQYDEATAILAGDALQSAAFEILAHPDTHEDGEVRASLVYKLARAAGAKGMAGGRMIDRLGVGEDLGQAARLQRMRTGALIGFALEIPMAMSTPAEGRRHALKGFAQDFGRAYQEAGLRRAEGEALDGAAAHERLALLSAQCKAHLDIFADDAKYLRECVDFVLDRRV